MFTKRHYEVIAAVIQARHEYAVEALNGPHDIKGFTIPAEYSAEEYAQIRYDAGYCHGIEGLANRLANYFEETEERFDKHRFLKACFG